VEEEALLLPGRVVPEHVDRAVEAVAHGDQVRRGHRVDLAHRRRELGQERRDLADERAQVVAHHRQGVAQQRARRAQVRRQLARQRTQRGQGGPRLGGEAACLDQRVARGPERARQPLDRRLQVRVALAQRAQHGGGGAGEAAQVVVAVGRGAGQEAQVVDQPLHLHPPVRYLAGDALGVLEGGLRRLEDRAQVRPAPLEPVAAGVQEHLEVAPRVRVERRQHGVRVHVRLRVLDRDPVAVLEASPAGQRRVRAARVHLHGHVVEARLRAQVQLGVPVDRADLVLLGDVEPHERVAVLDLHRADLAHLHARHVDRLSLPRGHGLRVLELRVELHLLLPREAQPLVGRDVQRHGQRQHDHRAQDRDVRQVRADVSPERRPHGVCLGTTRRLPGVLKAGPVSAARSGGSCVRHSTSGRYGGMLPV
jgi:hypothetical protein